ncbi:protein translocase subunit SecD [Cellulomonas wangsupingiae]|uniref:Protein translocase subunit SecD n=1 Tax=Cellulomonas wangsupingiae TaxID=2968085 RepID=A0ABY5K8U5_9CELL|nr:protein translocase subunit SecD [Cellulomonas wangsupingiae]MCC2333176.1 protein translocase subunit SecD [Cellulomonas wangsupingiae]MCM0641354.1 protein translocase subunit SecD [Cellulomonas wangsupingiae]UUI66889.1 protein translocase subunit SecD [Cellulomonas wangsupingiae]
MVVALFASILAGTRWGDASLTPNLALDLEGGTQVILEPVPEAKGDVTAETINQAIAVIRQRVDASGVAEAEITSQGGDKIVVALPGNPSEETLDLVRTSAQMEFRPVLVMGAAAATPTDPAAAAAAAAQPTKEAPDGPSDVAYYVTPEVQAEFDALDCTLPENRTGGVPGDPDEAFVACDQEGLAKFILGPVEIPGADIKSATSGMGSTSTGASTGQWVVNLEFTGEGTPKFTEVTTRLASSAAPLNQFAVVLDALVISAPSVNEVIPNGQAQISGSFTRESAETLANQLNFGSLPISFEEQSVQQISATLGSEQLQKGLLAGVFGLLLVVVYSLFQYRALGMVTVASLLVAAVVTYGIITFLSWVQGYRLSLPGVAGLIVAIGITADSFIVYFERIRDELRDGRPLGAAIDKGWERARRTILASDAVNFTAAVVLYLLAVGGVRGFAFTLGLTTLVDLLVVFLFTHPVMVLLGRTRFFAEGHPASGLDPRRLGVDTVRYAGRGRVAAPGQQTKGASPSDVREPVAVGSGGMTIAERRAAARAAEAASVPPHDDPPTTVTDDPAAGRPEGSDR